MYAYVDVFVHVYVHIYILHVHMDPLGKGHRMSCFLASTLCAFLLHVKAGLEWSVAETFTRAAFSAAVYLRGHMNRKVKAIYL